MDLMFRIEVDTGHGGYGCNDRIDELLEDVENEYGKETRDEVESWALRSRENDEFRKFGMYIINLGY